MAPAPLLRPLLGTLLAAALAGCSPEPASPEAEIQAMLARFEAAAEARDLGAAKDLVSGDYRDPRGNDKRAVKALLARYFFGHKAIFVLSRVRSIQLGEPPVRATAEVVAALTGVPVADAGELDTISADLYRFDLELAREEDGRWRVTSAGWRPAEIIEFF